MRTITCDQCGKLIARNEPVYNARRVILEEAEGECITLSAFDACSENCDRALVARIAKIVGEALALIADRGGSPS